MTFSGAAGGLIIVLLPMTPQSKSISVHNTMTQRASRRPVPNDRRMRIEDEKSPVIFHMVSYPTRHCKRNIEMTPLCKVEVTLPRVLGSRELHHGGGVDEQAGVQPA